MINASTLTFLRTLKKNNNKEWFDTHKTQYLQAKENIETVVGNTLKELCKIEKRFAGQTHKDCIFRIYRDVRFSKDKTPYKSNMGASFNIGGKKAMNAGYYLHIEPGKSFFGGGLWMPPGDILKKIRQEIDYNGKQFQKILSEKTLTKYYGELSQEYKLKTNPSGYTKDHPMIEHLKLNSFILWHDFTDKEIQSKNFTKEVAKAAKIMKPFLNFLNQALD